MVERKSIEIDGFRHANPIPNGSRVGKFVATGVIMGRDGDGTYPPTLDGQCALMFRHVQSIIEAAGGTTGNILKLNVYMKDPSDRSAVNAEWVRMFPDPHARPARHTYKDVSDSPALVQCDFLAVLD